MALKCFLISAALLPLTALTAHAQNTDEIQPLSLIPIEDEIIVTGLRAVPISDVTSSVTVLEIDELNIRNSPFVVDQLRSVPGVAVSRTGSLSGLTQVRIRGAEANHTLVLLNGVEVSDPTTGETDFGLWSGLNTQRIEVARGEQSGLYGSDAIGGVISITTGGEGFNAAGEAGSFGTFRGHAGYHGQAEKLTYGLAASGFTTNGVDTSGFDDERDGSDSYSGIANAAIEFSPDATLSALVSYRETDIETDSFFADTTEADQFITALTFDAQTGPVNHIVRANYSRVRRENFAAGNFSSETIGQRAKYSYSPSIDLGHDTQGLTISGLVERENEDFENINPDTTFGDSNQIVGFDSFALGGEVRGRHMAARRSL